MKVTEVSKHKAKLNGHTVRLRPVSTNSIRGGKFYIRFYGNYVELVRVVGGKFGCDAKHMRNDPHYRGKVKIGTMVEKLWGSGERRDDFYMSDLGCSDVKHGRTGAQLFEFTNDAYNLLKSLSEPQSHILMGRW